MSKYSYTHIITQGNVRTSEGELVGVLTRPKPAGFGLTETEVGKADRFVIRATDFIHPDQFTFCELYEGDAHSPSYTEQILGY